MMSVKDDDEIRNDNDVKDDGDDKVQNDTDIKDDDDVNR